MILKHLQSLYLVDFENQYTFKTKLTWYDYNTYNMQQLL